MDNCAFLLLLLLTDQLPAISIYSRMAENGSTSQVFLCVQDIMDKVLEKIESHPYTADAVEEYASAKSCSQSPQHQPVVGAFNPLNNVDEESKTMTAAFSDRDHIPLSCPVFRNSTKNLLSDAEKSFLVFLDDMRSLSTKEKSGTVDIGRQLSHLQGVKLRSPSVQELIANARGRAPGHPARDAPFLHSSLGSLDTRRSQLIPKSDGHAVASLPQEMKPFSTTNSCLESLFTAANGIHAAEVGQKQGECEQVKAMDLTEDVCETATEEKIPDSSYREASSNSGGVTQALNGVRYDGGYSKPELDVGGSGEDEIVTADDGVGNVLSWSRNNQIGIDANPREDNEVLSIFADAPKNSITANHSGSVSNVQEFGVRQTTRNEHDTAHNDIASDRQNSPEVTVCDSGVKNMDDFNRNLNVTIFHGGQSPGSRFLTDYNVQRNNEQCFDQMDGRPSDCEAVAVDFDGKVVHSDFTEAKQSFQCYEMNQGGIQHSDVDGHLASTPGLERKHHATHHDCRKVMEVLQYFESDVPEKHLMGHKERALSKQDIRGSPKNIPTGVRAFGNEKQADSTPEVEKKDEIVPEKSCLNQNAAWIVNEFDKHSGNDRRSTTGLDDIAHDQIDKRWNASARLLTGDGCNTSSPEKHSLLLVSSAGRRRESDDQDTQKVPDIENNVQSPFDPSFSDHGPRSQGSTESNSEQRLVTCNQLTGRDTEDVVQQIAPDEDSLVPDELSALQNKQTIESTGEESFYDEEERLKGMHASNFMLGDYRTS